MTRARSVALMMGALIFVISGCAPISGQGTGPPGSMVSGGSGATSGATSAPGATSGPSLVAPTAGSSATGGVAPQPVPADLQPALDQAANDVPVIYTDGCHLSLVETQPPPCVFGDVTSQIVVVLFGDSIAGQWFPALEQLAITHQWRLVSLTKSACTAADVRVWNSSLNGVYTQCDVWRENALARIAAEHPTLVVVSDDRLYELAIGGAPVPVAQATDVWTAGLSRTLARLHSMSGSVVLMGVTPRSKFDVPACLAAHLANALACATPARQAINAAWLATDRATAAATGARFIDPTPWVCPSDPCPPVIGNVLVYREQDHMTAVFSADLATRLGAALQVP